nr:ATP-binding protein [Pelagibacterium limicola]
MTDRVDYQLRLTQLRLRAASGEAQTQLCRPIDQAANVLQKTTKGEALAWNIDCPIDLWVRIDRHDLIELIGVLLENAVRHARARIEIAVSQTESMAEVVIADDGPGMSDAEIASAFERGVRFDEKGDRTGLGLAIAFDIATLNEGHLEIGKSSLGGLMATLALPLSPERRAFPDEGGA